MVTKPIQADEPPGGPTAKTADDAAAQAAHDPDALVDALAQSAFVVMGALTRIAAEHDLSLTQLRVLGILRDRRARMTELANFLGLDKSTMSGLVDRAERRGLLARGKNAADGRAVDVVMTTDGRRLASRVQTEIRRALAPTIDRLVADERQTLTGLLEHMLGSAQEPVHPASHRPHGQAEPAATPSSKATHNNRSDKYE